MADNHIMIAFIVLCFAGSSLPAALFAVIAHRRHRDGWSAWSAFSAHLFGLFALILGLIALAINGYIEDNGVDPAASLWYAYPLLAFAAVACPAAWWIALRPQTRA